MRIACPLLALTLVFCSCKNRGFSGEQSVAPQSRATRPRDPAESQALLKRLGVLAEIELDALERLLGIINEQLLSNIDAVDLSRYGAFSFAQQNFLTVGNMWKINAGVMQISGEDSLSVEGNHNFLLHRPQKWKHFNVEIGKRLIFLIPREHLGTLHDHRYSGEALIFSDKVALGALESNTDGKRGLFIWIYQAFSPSEALSMRITEKVEVWFEDRI